MKFPKYFLDTWSSAEYSNDYQVKCKAILVATGQWAADWLSECDSANGKGVIAASDYPIAAAFCKGIVDEDQSPNQYTISNVEITNCPDTPTSLSPDGSFIKCYFDTGAGIGAISASIYIDQCTIDNPKPYNFNNLCETVMTSVEQ